MHNNYLKIVDDYKTNIIKYFNDDLKYQMMYPEVFNIEFYNDRIILKPNIIHREPYMTSDGMIINTHRSLLERLKNDHYLKMSVLNDVGKYVRQVLPNAYDLTFYSDGTNLTIKFSTSEVKLIDKIPPKGHIGVYANIAYNLDLVDLDNFCKSNDEISSICKDGEFWGEMIRLRFPHYYLPVMKGYNRENLFRGLILYEDLLRKIEYNYKKKYIIDEPWVTLKTYYPDTLKYLIFNDLVKLNQTDIGTIISLDNSDLIKYILSKYHLNLNSYNDLLNQRFHDIDIMKIMLSGKVKDEQGDPLILHKDVLQEMFFFTIDHDEYIYPLEEFKFWYEYLDGSYSHDSLIDFLLWIYTIDPNTLNYILSKLPNEISVAQLMDYFKDGIRFNRYVVLEALWNKYGYLFEKEDIEELRDEIIQKHSDYLLDIFKYIEKR